MGNKSKQDQHKKTHLNDYEMSKLLRVKENQERLRELGVKKIAMSLTSLVESQKTKKKRANPSIANERDVEYTPDVLGDGDEDYYEEDVISKRVPKKQQRSQYIAPMSITRYANLAKQKRVVAPSMSHMPPFEEASNPNGQLADPNVTTRRGLQQSEKAREGHKQSRDLNAAKHNNSSSTFTMAELILKKKKSQRETEVFTQNSEKANSLTTSISSGARRKLSYINNDDDMEDGTRSQDLSEAHGLRNHVGADVNENIDNMIFGNIQNRIKRNGLTSQDVNDFEIEQDGVDDDENGELGQMFFENDGFEEDDIEDDLENEDDIHDDLENEDDTHDDLENEDDELAHQQLEHSRSPAISTTKKRGQTMLHGLQVRNINEREVIICNKYGQPVGPNSEEKDTVGKFSRFLGTIARNYSYAPLTYSSWHKVPRKDKDKMWQFVLQKYIVPENAKRWVLITIRASWRGHKSRLKKNHFYKYKDNKTRWENRPKGIPAKDFSQLLSLWSTKKEMNRCLQARNRRALQKNMHTAGPKSFARIREEMKNENPNKESPKQTEVFERTRQRREGNVYADSFDDTEKKIELMKNYKPPEEESMPLDPFLAVMSKEYDGHRRLFGKGVTNKLINKVNGGEGSYMVPREIMESLKVSVVDVESEKTRLDDMRREFEADQERKKAELAEDHERKKAELESIRKDIDNQRDKIAEDALQKLIQKLPPRVARNLFK